MILFTFYEEAAIAKRVRMLLQLFRFCMRLLWLLRLIKLASGYLVLRNRHGV